MIKIHMYSVADTRSMAKLNWGGGGKPQKKEMFCVDKAT
jgi:hypothetical protein